MSACSSICLRTCFISGSKLFLNFAPAAENSRFFFFIWLNNNTLCIESVYFDLVYNFLDSISLLPIGRVLPILTLNVQLSFLSLHRAGCTNLRHHAWHYFEPIYPFTNISVGSKYFLGKQCCLEHGNSDVLDYNIVFPLAVQLGVKLD